MENGKPARSGNFRIAPDVFRDALSRAMIGFYGQRCGTAVNITLDGQHLVAQDLPPAGRLPGPPAGSLKTDTAKPSLRGWHDAGDYGKYTTNGAFTVGMMLQAWERFPRRSARCRCRFPRRGGAIPDFLDEVKWELDWLLTTQFHDGSVSFKVTATNFESNVLPEDDGARRFYTDVSTAAAGDLPPVLAQAARVYEPYDAALAASYLEAARLGSLPGGDTAAAQPRSDRLLTGGYDASSPDRDNRLWAAAELWETTGEAAYLTAFES